MIRPTNLSFRLGLVLLPRLFNLAPSPQPNYHRLLLPAPEALDRRWKRISKIGYGRSSTKLGTSPRRDGLVWGPSYGTQTPDGTWWIADAAKRRLAHYSKTGRYLGDYPVPKKFLHLGYFQWQNPIALDNGSVILTAALMESPALLVMSPTGHFARVQLKRFVNVRISDGVYLYGFDEDGTRVQIDPTTGRITSASWFRGQKRHKFRIFTNQTFLTIERPGVLVKLKLEASDHPTRNVQPSVEAVMARNGRLWILVQGTVELANHKTTTAAGLFSVSRTGKVSPVDGIPSLTSEADPGDGLHLGIQTGAKTPWLMFVDPDALKIFRKR